VDRRVLGAFVLVVAAVALRVLGAFHGLAFDYASIACSALAALCFFTVRRAKASKAQPWSRADAHQRTHSCQ
jgi:hypothetical protein